MLVAITMAGEIGPTSLSECTRGTDKYNCFLLDALQPLIKEILLPRHVTSELGDFLPKASLSLIWNEERSSGPHAAVELLLKELMKHKRIGWFRGFLDKLSANGYSYLAKQIENFQEEHVGDENQRYFINIINIPAFPRLRKEVVPEHVLSYLRQKDTISEQDYEEIQTRIRESGNIQGMDLLLDRVGRHKDTVDWFTDLINALQQTECQNYLDIVKSIEPTFLKVTESETPKVSKNFIAVNKSPEQFRVAGDERGHSQPEVCKVTPSSRTQPRQDGMDWEDVQVASLHYTSQPTADPSVDAGNFESPPHHRATPEGREVSPEPSIEFCTADATEVNSATCTASQSHAFSFDSTIQSYATAQPELPPGGDETQVKSKETNNTNPLLSSRPDTENNLATSLHNNKPEIDKKILNIFPDGDTHNNMSISTSSTGSEIAVPDQDLSCHDNSAEGPVSSNEPTDIIHEQLNLRDYQTELAQKAISGQNVIIVAPTGSGKTHVALAISQHHLREQERGVGKVVFFVPTVELVNQQWKLYQTYLSEFQSYGMSGDIQDSQKVPLSDLVAKYDIILMTPQIMVDALRNETLDSVGEFTLMIFDECHHAMKQHPYSMIMRFYLEEKLAPIEERTIISLPQIIGLTASVGVGKAKNMKQAQEHILSLCGNLDCEDISTVEANKIQLKESVNNPEERKEETQGRTEDPFSDIVKQIVSKIEMVMKKAAGTAGVPQLSGIQQTLSRSPTPGSDPYTQWISILEKSIARIYEQHIRRPLTACIMQLKVYHDALKINADCRTKDAVEYLQKQLKEIHIPYKDRTDEYLEQLLKEKIATLEQISKERRYDNPKLNKLGQLILEHEKNSENMRVIIFCKTRALTIALQNWMKETPGLKHLNPSRVVGGTSAAKGGMTQSQQEDVLTYFKDGIHKVIVATSVAEEGLDVSKCNLVIRYEYVTNEIAMIQARGRGRAEDSKYVVVSQRGRGLAEKEDLNKIRESMMNKAIQRIKEMSDQERVQLIRHQQQQAQTEWQMAEVEKKTKLLSRVKSDHTWELRCMKCDQLGCFSSDVRLVNGNHHFIIDETFHERVIVEPHPNPISYDDIQKTDKIFCSKCHYDWGIMAIYKGTKFCVLKVVSFVLVNTQTGIRDTKKKWKDVPFMVDPLTPEELQTYAMHCIRQQNEEH